MLVVNITVGIAIFLLLVAITLMYSSKRSKAKRDDWEESIYKQVVRDLENNKKRYGLWKLAMKESNGLEDTCESLYIAYCVQSIIGEHEILGTVRI